MPREILPTIQEKMFKTFNKDYSDPYNYGQEMKIPFTTDRSISFVGDLMMVGISLS